MLFPIHFLRLNSNMEIFKYIGHSIFSRIEVIKMINLVLEK